MIVNLIGFFPHNLFLHWPCLTFSFYLNLIFQMIRMLIADNGKHFRIYEDCIFLSCVYLSG